MKRNYTITTILMLVLVTFYATQLKAQVRILKLDPATNSVTLKNFGSTNVPISNYWFCNFPSYAQVANMTSVASLDAGEEVNIESDINFAVADGEFGLYNTNSFSSSAAMIDYLQWGSANHQRESVAVAAGLWDVGTFVNVAPPFEYTGNGTQNGVTNWVTLSIEDFNNQNSFKLFPNPVDDIITIEFANRVLEGTIQVFDMLGKQLLNTTITTNTAPQINVSGFKSGLYLIKIASENGEETKRFVKQ